MKTAQCKYCSASVPLLSNNTSTAMVKAGELYLAGHSTPSGRPCVLGSGELAKENMKPLVNPKLFTG